jgi:hypothetical protein
MLAKLIASDRYTFQNKLQIFDGRHIQLGSANGTKIGTAANQKLAFFGVTPIVQPGAVTTPSGGSTTDTQARTSIVQLINVVHNLGLTS